jgi:hypothetical protein
VQKNKSLETNDWRQMTGDKRRNQNQTKMKQKENHQVITLSHKKCQSLQGYHPGYDDAHKLSTPRRV